jgi:DNA-binding transcriptional ArsR family regulator
MELDFKAVKALSSPTRLKILRQVLEKDATPTQLSNDLDRSKSTISSHLAKLQKAGLVEKDQKEGRKRVVYSPTRKADTIVSGKQRKVKFSIASSALSALVGVAVTGAGLDLYGGRYLDSRAAQASSDVGTMGAMEQEAMNTAARESSQLVSLSPDILFYLGVGLLGVSALGFAYGIILRKLGDG